MKALNSCVLCLLTVAFPTRTSFSAPQHEDPLQVGTEKQRLVDDHVIAERHDVSRVPGTVTKHGKDRSIGYRAGVQAGTIITRAFRLEGDRLQVNVDATEGEMRVELLDESNHPIAGFYGDRAQLSTHVDSLRLQPMWWFGPDLSALRGQIVRLKFYLRGATLYAFQVKEQSESFRVVDARDDAKETPRDSICAASLCMRPRSFNTPANARHIEAMLREAARRGARLVVTPECALTGYVESLLSEHEDSPLKRDLAKRMQESAEPIDGPHIARFKDLARELNLYLVLGLVEAVDDRQYNTAALIGPDGSILGKHQKVWWGSTKRGQDMPTGFRKGELPPNFTYAAFDEYPTFEIFGVKTGLMICTERENPTIPRRLAEAGAQLIICPSFGSNGNDVLMSRHSIENHLGTILVNPYEAVMTDEEGKVLLNVLQEDVICIQNMSLPKR